MSPIFGRQDDDKQERADAWTLDLKAELDRLASMSLAELAVEVMVKGFGPGGPGAENGHPRPVRVGAHEFAAASASVVASRFLPERGVRLPPPSEDQLKLHMRITGLVAEGLQALEHASLVRLSSDLRQPYTVEYATTRRGRAALERDEVKTIVEAAR